jgi:hypothetical protein
MYNMILGVRSLRLFSVASSMLVVSVGVQAQINTNGCTLADFGINAGLYTNTTFTTGTVRPPAGSVDWFKASGGTGRNVISQTNASTIQTLLQGGGNPSYEARMNGSIFSQADVVSAGQYRKMIDAVWARDKFGGTGALDPTAFVVSSKNGDDPALWYPGEGNVLGKNDLIDIAAHMFRNVNTATSKNDLWFTGLINRAEPGGSAYMDFEFYIQNVALYNPTPTTLKFTSGGPDMGHTSFQFNASGAITRLGDVLYNLSLEGGGTVPSLEVRIWMSRATYDAYRASAPASLPFVLGDQFDGAGTNAPFGYASIQPKTGSGFELCGYVNTDVQLPLAPPWGTLNTKSHVYGTSYIPYSVAEVGLNMTALGFDNMLVPGYSACGFPWTRLIIKTRSSSSFTAALKDFAGIYGWGVPSVVGTASNAILSCSNQTPTLTATPSYSDVTYTWSTIGGNIVGSSTGSSITVNKAGTYSVKMTLSDGCELNSDPVTVTSNPSQPLISAATTTSTVSCTGSSGTVDLTVTGGTAPSTYAWTKTGTSGTYATTQDLTGLAAGTYTAAISDANGCSFTSQTATVLAATPMTAPASTTNVTCYNGTNGAIDITPTGKATLSYLWSTGNTTQDLTNIKAGSYSLTMTDGDGCTSSYNYTVTQPTALSASATKSDDTDASLSVGNGSINLTASGGTTAYTYAWTGPSSYTSTSEDPTALKYGSYTVTVTDANACTTTATAFIYEPEQCFDAVDNDGDGLTDCDDGQCVPAAPVVTGSTNPCVNAEENYSISSPVAGVRYAWVVPSNATIISGQNTSTLRVKWTSSVPGQICVRAANDGPVVVPQIICYSVETCYTVNPEAVPAIPSAINKN